MQQPKKILYCITKGNWGGAQRYVYDLSTHLPPGFEAVVACGANDGSALIQNLIPKGIRTIELSSSQRDISIIKEIKLFFELYKIIKKEKPDILHLNSSKIGGVGALAGRLARVPRIIFTSHGWAFKEERGSLEKFIILLLHWITVMLSHLTIAVSQKTKENISYMPFVKNKIIVIHNGIEKFDTLNKEEAEKILERKNKDQITIFSISELHRNKGLDRVIKGISLLRNDIKSKVHYYIAGSGEEEGKLTRLIQELRLEDRVNLLGFVPNAKKLLTGADIFMFYSRNENLPFAILEAGLVGLPIIASNVGGVPEIIQDEKNGYLIIDSRGAKEIAEYITELVENPEKRKWFGSEIQKTVSQNFSLEKMLAETIALYSN